MGINKKELSLEDRVDRLYMAHLFRNSFSLGCFTLLAIVFKHWWIVFFATAFLSEFRITKKKDK